MNINEIKILLEKFYAGETSIEEEKRLQKYFVENHDNVDDFAAEKYLFANISVDDVEIPVGLTGNIIAKIDEASKKELATKHIFTHLRRINLWTSSLAAAYVAILISIAVLNFSEKEMPKFIANVDMSEFEVIKMLEDSFSEISNVVDEAVILLDVANERVCEINEELNQL
jgi:hypothetical protein